MADPVLIYVHLDFFFMGHVLMTSKKPRIGALKTPFQVNKTVTDQFMSAMNTRTSQRGVQQTHCTFEKSWCKQGAMCMLCVFHLIYIKFDFPQQIPIEAYKIGYLL